MKRLTERGTNGTAMAACCGENCKYNFCCENSRFAECGDMDDIIDRLAAIEDILGDEYELDRLRELVEADKEGRCAVFSPGYPVVSTYHKDDDGRVIREVAGVVSEAEAEAEAALKVGEQDGHR